MNHPRDPADALFLMLAGTAERALSIGASAAGLAIWALVPGYVYYAAYLYSLGVPWAIGMLSTTTIGVAGVLVLALLLVNVLAALFFRFTVPWAPHAMRFANVISALAMLSIAVGITVQVSWLNGFFVQVTFGVSMILGTAASICTVIHRAATEPLTIQQKLVAAICLPFVSVLFAALIGNFIASAELRRGTDALPEARLVAGTDKVWRSLLPLGDRFLLVSGSLKASHAFRVVAATDVKELTYPASNP